ncbi:hypothetical protein BC629DRAFT_912223 [Irpex lacteus]|nr:hypothetical protein BC629DRAFT_912223 [Irpex lacteus]
MSKANIGLLYSRNDFAPLMTMSAGWTVANESAAMTLTLYEYLLTFSQEIDLPWGQHRPTSTMGRHQFANSGQSNCTVASRLSETFSLVLYASTAILVMIRLYVVSNRNVWLLVAITALGVLFSTVNIYYFATLKFNALQAPYTGCQGQTSLHLSGVNIVMAIVVVESIVVAVTWINTLSIIRLTREASSRNHKGVSYLVLRDGSVYFITLLLMNILSLLAFRVKLMSNSATYVDTLSSILISRFVLNLRDDNGRSSDPDRTLHMSHLTDLRFSSAPHGRLVGNLGQSLCLENGIELEDMSRTASVA